MFAAVCVCFFSLKKAIQYLKKQFVSSFISITSPLMDGKKIKLKLESENWK